MPAHVAVLFDGEHENSRTALGAGYKANRAIQSLLGAVPYTDMSLGELRGERLEKYGNIDQYSRK